VPHAIVSGVATMDAPFNLIKRVLFSRAQR
jgi:hypothetical protein